MTTLTIPAEQSGKKTKGSRSKSPRPSSPKPTSQKTFFPRPAACEPELLNAVALEAKALRSAVSSESTVGSSAVAKASMVSGKSPSKTKVSRMAKRSQKTNASQSDRGSKAKMGKSSRSSVLELNEDRGASLSDGVQVGLRATRSSRHVKFGDGTREEFCVSDMGLLSETMELDDSSEGLGVADSRLPRSVQLMMSEAFWSTSGGSVACRPGTAWAEIIGSVESGTYRRTFDSDELERDFIAFCQMTSPVLWSGREAEAKLRDLLEQASRHVVLAGFGDVGAADTICGGSLLEPMEDRIEIDKWVESQSMFAALCAARIMTVPEEISVVRRMHYLKYLAWQILTGDAVDAWDLVRAAGLMKAAQWHRDLMVQSNMRLVVSIVKKLPVPQVWHDELVSDGIVALLRAVDKFDPSRGYRFCTYATPVIRRECFQQIQARTEERSRYTQSQALPMLASTHVGIDSNSDRAHWIAWRGRLETLMDKLTRREQLIIRSRYCLGAHRNVKTLQRLAAALKISKERVRQLEYSALAKLRAAAERDA